MLDWPPTSSGYKSISLTTQSESVPLVEATKLAIGWPLIFIGALNVSETKTRTSGRPDCFALIVHEPLRPGHAVVVAHGLNGARAIWNGLGGIGDVFVERTHR